MAQQCLDMFGLEAVGPEASITELMQLIGGLRENSRARVSGRVRAITILLRELIELKIELSHGVAPPPNTDRFVVIPFLILPSVIRSIVVLVGRSVTHLFDW